MAQYPTHPAHRLAGFGAGFGIVDDANDNQQDARSSLEFNRVTTKRTKGYSTTTRGSQRCTQQPRIKHIHENEG